MLAEFRTYLKSLNLAENYYIGKIDNTKLKTIGIYSQSNFRRVESIGKQSSYDIAGVRILVHWNKNARESEDAARKVFESIRYITGTDMTNSRQVVSNGVTSTETTTVHVDYLDLLDAEPALIGTDDNGVYEYHISARLYYRR